MTLREKQSVFARLLALLILKAEEIGYEVTLGEVWRSEAEAERRGFRESLHTKRLAADINLFSDGIYMTDTESHRELGEYWESLSEGEEWECCWGGRFGDGNHYSVAHEGVR